MLSSRANKGSRRVFRRFVIMGVATAGLVVGGLTLVAPEAAHAQPVAHSALIDADSITTVDGITDTSDNPISLEQYAAEQAGYTVTVVTGTQWDAMTAAQFAQYQLLIVGDPDCSDTPASATSNASTWVPVVMGTSGLNPTVGNRVVIGTDPEYHYAAGQGAAQPSTAGDPLTAGAETVVQDGITYAGGVSGATGAYFDTSCYDAGSDVSVLNSLSASGAGFTEDSSPPCGGSVALIASNPVFSSLTDTDIEGWECSVHVAFPTYPTDWQALAVATDTATTPTCGTDPDTSTTACGEAYILVAGAGIVVTAPDLTLTPATNSDPAGGTHTVTATVTQSGSPSSGQLVSFAVTGQNAGVSGTCVPASCMSNSSGQVTFTYPDTNGAGIDTIDASVTISSTTEHATAGETWTSSATGTQISTSLSGGGKSGATISVPMDTEVSDSGTLSGTHAATATGTVTYNVYSDSGCTTAVNTGTAQNITTAGTLPASASVSLDTPGTYYWQASYSGDTANSPSKSTCGSEVETVTETVSPQPTQLSTSLSGGSESGATISVPENTAVTDAATLSGTNAATATGTVTYNVYSDSKCMTAVNSGTAQSITTAGTLPASASVSLSVPGTYYWQASYSGDSLDSPSTSTCGSEVETVTSPTKPQPTKLTTSLLGTDFFSGEWCWWVGRTVTVFGGTGVTDSASLSGPNAATAGGTVTYTVYSNLWHGHPVANAGTVTVTDGVVPNSKTETLPPGTYYWQASYSGDPLNAPSTSKIGSEIEIVVPEPSCKPPRFRGWGWGSGGSWDYGPSSFCAPGKRSGVWVGGGGNSW
jgi:hypothetical protein